MAKEKFVIMFQNLDINELEFELEKRKTQLCNLSNIENMSELIEEIEALEFLIRDAEARG